MPKTNHTPEPWSVAPWPDDHNEYAIYDRAPDSADGECIAVACDLLDGQGAANAARIVACVNACAGINPDAVPDMLGALRAMLAHEGERVTSGIGTEHDTDALEAARESARAAIAKAEG